MRPSIVTVLLLIGAELIPASAQESDPLAKFVGNWTCKGHFTSNGAPLAARLSIQRDALSGALILRHDDVAPGAYHALEVWTVNKSGIGAKAAISDKFSGMRWFESPGWAGRTLTWIRLDNGTAAEQFAYEFRGDALQVEWSTARSGTMKLGDSLLCHHT